MLDELRALGGAAENICLRQGPLGRGLFSIDPAKPVHLHIPKNLLIPCEDMVLERGALRVGPGANVGPRERAFLDGYQSKLGWGDGGGAEIARMFEMARTLPAELRHELLTQHRCGSWFEEPTDELMRELYLGARCITFEQRTTVMPFIELANHGETTEFVFRDGIALEGMFSGEVLASYSPLDSYGFFLGWGFVTEQPIALSIDLTGHIGASPLHVERIFKPSPETQRAWLPRLSTDRGEPVVDFLMIGNRRYPRLRQGNILSPHGGCRLFQRGGGVRYDPSRQSATFSRLDFRAGRLRPALGEDAAKNGAVPAQGDVFLLWRARDLGIFVTDARIEPRFRFD